MPERRYTYRLDFDVNKKQLDKLKKDLSEIQQLTRQGVINKYSVNLNEKQLENLTAAAGKLQRALTQAYNPKMDMVNLQQFNKFLEDNETSISQIEKEFDKLGDAGVAAFQKIKSQAYNTNIIMKESHTFLKKIGTTFLNSTKWFISSNLVNNFANSIERAWGFTQSLDASLNDIRIVTGDSTKQMEQFAKQANIAAKNLGKTTTDYTRANLIYRQQGLSAQEAAVRTDITLKTANVTGQSTEQVSEELTSIWNGYKAGAKEAELYIDRLAAIAANSASNLQELSIGMSKVASAANSMGVSEEQLASQLSTIIEVTRQAPESVGTALRTIYARITDIEAGISEDDVTLGLYSGEMEKLGFNVLDTSGKLRDLGAVIEEIGGKWNTLTREQQVSLAQTMAGQRQYSNLIALFDNFEKYNEMMQVAADSAGTLERQQSIYMDGLDARLNKLTASFEHFYSEMFNTDSLKTLVDLFTNITTAIGDMVKAVGGGAGVFNLLATIGLSALKNNISKSLKISASNRRKEKFERGNLEAGIETQDKIIEENKAVLKDTNATDEEKAAAQVKIDIAKRRKQVFEMQKNSNGLITEDDLNALHKYNDELEKTQMHLLNLQKMQKSIETDEDKRVVALKIAQYAQEQLGFTDEENNEIKEIVQIGTKEDSEVTPEEREKISKFLEKYKDENGNLYKVVQEQFEQDQTVRGEAQERATIALKNAETTSKKYQEANKKYKEVEQQANRAEKNFKGSEGELNQDLQYLNTKFFDDGQQDVTEENFAQKLTEKENQLNDEQEDIQLELEEIQQNKIKKQKEIYNKRENSLKLDEPQKKLIEDWKLQQEIQRELTAKIQEAEKQSLQHQKQAGYGAILLNANPAIERMKAELQTAKEKSLELHKQILEGKRLKEKFSNELRQLMKEYFSLIDQEDLKIQQQQAFKHTVDDFSYVKGNLQGHVKEKEDFQAKREKAKKLLQKEWNNVQARQQQQRKPIYDFIDSIQKSPQLNQGQKKSIAERIAKIKALKGNIYSKVNQQDASGTEIPDSSNFFQLTKYLNEIINLTKGSEQEFEKFRSQLAALGIDIKKETNEAKADIDSINAAWKEFKNSFTVENVIQGTMDVIESVSQISTGIQQLGNGFKNLTDPEENGWTKLGQFITSTATSVFDFYQGIKGFKEEIGTMQSTINSWAKATGKAVLDSEGNVIKLTGIAKGLSFALKGVSAAAIGVSVAITAWNIFKGIAQGIIENQRKRNKAIMETSDKTIQQSKAAYELAKSLTTLNDEYKQGSLSNSQLKQKIIELCNQYDIENEKVLQLISSYKDLDKAKQKIEKEAVKKELAASQAGIVAATQTLYNVQTRERGPLNNGYWYSINTNNSEIKDLLKQAGWIEKGWGWTMKAGGNNPTAYTIAQAYMTLSEGIKNIQNSKNASELLGTTEYKTLLQAFEYANEEQHAGKKIKEYYDSIMTALIVDILEVFNLEQVKTLTAYDNILNKIKESLQKNPIISAFGTNENSLENIIENYFKKNEAQLYSQYGVKSQAFSKINFENEDVKQKAKKAISELKLDEKQISSLVELDPEILNNWEKLDKVLKNISEFKGINYSQAELDRMGNYLEIYNELIDKVTSGKRVDNKTYQTYIKNNDILEEMFIKGIGGWVLKNQFSSKDLETALDKAYASEFGGKSQGANYQIGVLNNQIANIRGINQEDIKRILSVENWSKDIEKIQQKRNSLRERMSKGALTEEDLQLLSQQKLGEQAESLYNTLYLKYGVPITSSFILKSLIPRLSSQSIEKIVNQIYEDDEILQEKLENAKKYQNELFNQQNDNTFKQAISILKATKSYSEDMVFKANVDEWEKNKVNLSDNQKKLFEQALSGVSAESVDIDKLQESLQQLNESLLENVQYMDSLLFRQDADVSDSELYKLNEILKEAIQNGNTFNETLHFEDSGLQYYNIKKLTEEIIRFNKGLESSIKNLTSWESLINNKDAVVSLDELKNAYEDILGLKGDTLSTDFLKDEQNYEYLKATIASIGENNLTEAEKYLNWLRDSALYSLQAQAGLTQDIITATEDAKAAVADKKIGQIIKQQIVTGLFDALKAAKYTAQQIESYFNMMDISVTLEVTEDDILLNAANLATKAAPASFLLSQINPEIQANAKAVQDRIVKEKALTKYLDKEVDLYHDINIELGLIDRKLSNLQKIQKNLTGFELLNNLKAQNRALDEQNQKLKQKEQIQRQDLLNQSSILKGLGFTFNSDGSLSNYAEVYSAAIAGVNNVITQIREQEQRMVGLDTSSDAYKEIDDQLKHLQFIQSQKQEYLDRVEKYINKYDSTREQLFDVIDKIDDVQREQIELNLQAFETKIQIKLDLTQAKKDWEHFVAEVIDREDILNPNRFKNNQNIVSLALKDVDFLNKDINDLVEKRIAYTEELRKFEEARQSGTIYQSQIFNSYSEAATALQENENVIRDKLQEYANSIDSIKQAILDSYNNIAEAFEKNMQIYNFISEQLNHNVKLIDLIEGVNGGRAKDNYYNRIAQNNIEIVRQLREQIKFWETETAKATSSEAKKIAQEQWQDAVTQLNSVTEQGIENLKTQYTNLIDTIAKELENKLTNNHGFDYFDIEWDYVKKQADSYLDTINAAFAIKNTEFNYQKAINDAADLRNQQKLKDAMREQLNILKAKDKLTQYDVDRANKILDIQKARIALEQARNNKTQMRLRRDSQGNYSYQFTADQDAIDDALNRLDKLKNELYNLDLQAYKNNTDAIMQLTKETAQKIAEIHKDETLTEEQRQQRLKLIYENYQRQLNFLTEENQNIRSNLMQSAADAYSDLIKQGQIDYNTMIMGWNSDTQNWIQNFVTNPDSAIEMFKKGMQQMTKAGEEYKDKLHEYLNEAGIDLNNLKDGIDPVVESSQNAVESLDTLITKMNEISNNIQGWNSKLQGLEGGFGNLADEAARAAQNIVKYKTALSNETSNSSVGGAISQVANAVSGSLKALDNNFASGGGKSTSGTKAPSPPPSLQGLWTKKKTKSSTMDDRNFLDYIGSFIDDDAELVRQIIGPLQRKGNSLQDIITMLFESDDDNDKILSSEYFQKGFKSVTNKLYKKNKSTYEGKRIYNENQFNQVFPNGNQNGNNYKIFTIMWNLLLKKYSSIDPSRLFSGFDTGGYTGNWNSSQGKLAVLHEKELILNKQDTENMLQMLKITRSMLQNNISTNLANQLVKLSSPYEKITSQLLTNNQEQLDQQVHISATFPAVNTKKEIEQALSNLVNIAAQRALKINKQ